MKKVKKSPFSEYIRNIWKKLFLSNNPFKDVFSSLVKDRLLLYPTHGYHLTEEQYHALVGTIQEMGETAFYISEIEYSGDFLSKGQHWLCALPNYQEYKQIPLVLENTVYSEIGTFGLIISHEDHGLIGGKKEFIDAFKQRYPAWEKDRKILKKDWKEKMARPMLDITS
ncbi:MAG: hypothetical protein S4CHLAM45_07460 [Chlamydiales bacterium]|nr:hypothetical protein [Chlamydiales bacterium]MCH9622853.1 hypothetical protein [Chlamydiales bacterium]